MTKQARGAVPSAWATPPERNADAIELEAESLAPLTAAILKARRGGTPKGHSQIYRPMSAHGPHYQQNPVLFSQSLVTSAGTFSGREGYSQRSRGGGAVTALEDSIARLSVLQTRIKKGGEGAAEILPGGAERSSIRKGLMSPTWRRDPIDDVSQGGEKQRRRSLRDEIESAERALKKGLSQAVFTTPEGDIKRVIQEGVAAPPRNDGAVQTARDAPGGNEGGSAEQELDPPISKERNYQSNGRGNLDNELHNVKQQQFSGGENLESKPLRPWQEAAGFTFDTEGRGFGRNLSSAFGSQKVEMLEGTGQKALWSTQVSRGDSLGPGNEPKRLQKLEDTPESAFLHLKKAAAFPLQKKGSLDFEGSKLKRLLRGEESKSEQKTESVTVCISECSPRPHRHSEGVLSETVGSSVGSGAIASLLGRVSFLEAERVPLEGRLYEAIGSMSASLERAFHHRVERLEATMHESVAEAVAFLSKKASSEIQTELQKAQTEIEKKLGPAEMARLGKRAVGILGARIGARVTALETKAARALTVAKRSESKLRQLEAAHALNDGHVSHLTAKIKKLKERAEVAHPSRSASPCGCGGVCRGLEEGLEGLRKEVEDLKSSKGRRERDTVTVEGSRREIDDLKMEWKERKAEWETKKTEENKGGEGRCKMAEAQSKVLEKIVRELEQERGFRTEAESVQHRNRKESEELQKRVAVLEGSGSSEEELREERRKIKDEMERLEANIRTEMAATFKRNERNVRTELDGMRRELSTEVASKVKKEAEDVQRLVEELSERSEKVTESVQRIENRQKRTEEDSARNLKALEEGFQVLRGEMEAEIASCNARVTELQDLREKETEGLRESVEALKSVSDETTERLAELEEGLEGLKPLAGEIADVREEGRRRLEGVLADVRAADEKLRGDMQRGLEALKPLAGEIAAVREECLDRLAGEIADVREADEKLRGDMQKGLEGLEKRVEGLEEGVSEVLSIQGVEEGRKEELQRGLEDLEGRVVTLEDGLADVRRGESSKGEMQKDSKGGGQIEEGPSGVSRKEGNGKDQNVGAFERSENSIAESPAGGSRLEEEFVKQERFEELTERVLRLEASLETVAENSEKDGGCALEESVAELRERLGEVGLLNEELRTLNLEMESVREQQESGSEESRAETRRLKGEVREMDIKVNGDERGHVELEKVAELSASIESLVNGFEKLGEKSEKTDEELDGLRKEINDLRDTVETSQSESDAKADGLHGDVTKLAESVARLETGGKETEANVKRLQDSMVILEESLEGLGTEQAERNERERKMDVRIMLIESEADGLGKKLESIQERERNSAEKTEEQMADIMARLPDDFRCSVEELVERNAGTEQKVEEIRLKMEGLEEDLRRPLAECHVDQRVERLALAVGKLAHTCARDHEALAAGRGPHHSGVEVTSSAGGEHLGGEEGCLREGSDGKSWVGKEGERNVLGEELSSSIGGENSRDEGAAWGGGLSGERDTDTEGRKGRKGKLESRRLGERRSGRFDFSDGETSDGEISVQENSDKPDQSPANGPLEIGDAFRAPFGSTFSAQVADLPPGSASEDGETVSVDTWAAAQSAAGLNPLYELGAPSGADSAGDMPGVKTPRLETGLGSEALQMHQNMLYLSPISPPSTATSPSDVRLTSVIRPGATLEPLPTLREGSSEVQGESRSDFSGVKAPLNQTDVVTPPDGSGISTPQNGTPANGSPISRRPPSLKLDALPSNNTYNPITRPRSPLGRRSRTHASFSEREWLHPARNPIEVPSGRESFSSVTSPMSPGSPARGALPVFAERRERTRGEKSPSPVCPSPGLAHDFLDPKELTPSPSPATRDQNGARSWSPEGGSPGGGADKGTVTPPSRDSLENEADVSMDPGGLDDAVILRRVANGREGESEKGTGLITTSAPLAADAIILPVGGADREESISQSPSLGRYGNAKPGEQDEYSDSQSDVSEHEIDAGEEEIPEEMDDWDLGVEGLEDVLGSG